MLNRFMGIISLSTVLASLLINTGCNTGISNNGKVTETFKVSQNSHLEDTGNIVSGENYVFTYTRNEVPIPNATDVGVNYVVVFEIDKNNINSFSFENENLAKINAMRAKLCFCPPDETKYQKITQGSIKGQKNNNSWKVDGKLDATYSFSGNFM